MEPSTARFTFKSNGLDIEFEGTEAFVTAQVEYVSAKIRAEISGAGRNTPAPTGTSPVGTSPTGAAPVTTVTATAVTTSTEETPAAAPQAQTTAEAPTMEEFYRRANCREGRGALQDRILVFSYFLREYRGKDEVSIDNLNACFSLVGIAPPKSLANTMGIMKRNQGFFYSATRRGHYGLTEKGIALVERLTMGP